MANNAQWVQQAAIAHAALHILIEHLSGENAIRKRRPIGTIQFGNWFEARARFSLQISTCELMTEGPEFWARVLEPHVIYMASWIKLAADGAQAIQFVGLEPVAGMTSFSVSDSAEQMALRYMQGYDIANDGFHMVVDCVWLEGYR